MNDCRYIPQYCDTRTNKIVARPDNSKCGTGFVMTDMPCPPCKYVSRCQNNVIRNIKDPSPNYAESAYCSGDPVVFATPYPQLCVPECQGLSDQNCEFSKCEKNGQMMNMQYYDRNGYVINNVPQVNCLLGCSDKSKQVLSIPGIKTYNTAIKCPPRPTNQVSLR